jgi:IclR family acetate operon transcriptional repressor
MESRRPSTLIASVQRALRLLEATSLHATGAPAKVLARDAGLPLGTAYHLLRTLAYEGYLRRLDDGGYVLGDRVDGLLVEGRFQTALARARPALMALRDVAGAAAYLARYADGEITVVEIVDGPKTPRADLWVGFQEAGHATALGKCVLASLDPPGRRDYLARHPLADLTPRTITHQDLLLHELETGPPGGFAFDREEYALGTACAAAPFADGSSVGAVGVSVRAERLPELERAAAPWLALTARRVARAFALTI